MQNDPRRTRALQLLGVLLAASMLWVTFRDVNVTHVSYLLTDTVSVVALIVLPFGVINFVDALAWRSLLRRLGVSVRFVDVYTTQLASEAAIMSLPMGFAVSESMRPYLLHLRARAPWDTAIASTAARKVCLILGEGVVLGLACCVSANVFAEVSGDMLGSGGLPWLVGLTATLLCSVAVGMAVLLGRGALATRLLRVLRRFSPRRFVHRLERAEGFTQTDRALFELFQSPKAMASHGGVLGFYIAIWLMEAIEAFVVLRVIGVDVSFEAVLAMETSLAFLRSLFAVLPAGLGVQDVGYVLFLKALGVPDALVAGAAFSLIKRSKECLWIVIGYLCLFWAGRATEPEPEGAVASSVFTRAKELISGAMTPSARVD